MNLSKPINVQYEMVESSLSSLESATQSLEVPKSVSPELNQLTCCNKLSQIITKLQQATTSYHSLLTNNELAARQSLQSLRQTDEQLSRLMK